MDVIVAQCCDTSYKLRITLVYDLSLEAREGAATVMIHDIVDRCFNSG